MRTNGEEPSRSQEVRNRRRQQSQERAHRAAEQSRRPTVNTPPVMARSPMAGASVRRKTQGTVRRQVYVPLRTQGAEVRLPALPVIRPGWRLASGFLVVVLAIALWSLWNADMFKINAVKLTGAKRLTKDDVLQALNVQGMPIIEASPDEMKETLLAAFPELSSVSVEVGLPANVTVRLKERIPVLAWKKGDQVQWVDQEGIAFPARGTQEGLVTIEAEGDPAPAQPAEPAKKTEDGQDEPKSISPTRVFLPPEMIDTMVKLSKQAPTGQPILFSPSYGLGWNDPQGWKVYFGMKTDDMELKINQYQTIVQSLASQGIHPSLISVEFQDAPFYRLEQ